MKKNIEILTQIVAGIIFVTGAVYTFSIVVEKFPLIWRIINTPFFSTIGTLIVGLGAYIIYIKQKSDHKKEVANLIVQEIRYAEDRVHEAWDRGHEYFLKVKMLPTNNWYKNIHLFVSDLGENGTDTISKFYSTVGYIDSLIAKISDEKTFPRNHETNIPEIQNALKTLTRVSQEVNFIYNSPAVDLLRKLSR